MFDLSYHRLPTILFLHPLKFKFLPFFHPRSQLLNNTWNQAGHNSKQWTQWNQAGHDGKGIGV